MVKNKMSRFYDSLCSYTVFMLHFYTVCFLSMKPQSWNVESATRTTPTAIYGGSLIIIGDRLFNNRAYGATFLTYRP